MYKIRSNKGSTKTWDYTVHEVELRDLVNIKTHPIWSGMYRDREGLRPVYGWTEHRLESRRHTTAEKSPYLYETTPKWESHSVIKHNVTVGHLIDKFKIFKKKKNHSIVYSIKFSNHPRPPFSVSRDVRRFRPDSLRVDTLQGSPRNTPHSLYTKTPPNSLLVHLLITNLIMKFLLIIWQSRLKSFHQSYEIVTSHKTDIRD